MEDPRVVEFIGIGVGLAIIGLIAWLGPKWKLRALQWKWIQRLRGTPRSDLRAILCRDFPAGRRLCADAEASRSAFLRACIDLEAGELESARTFAARVANDEPVRPVLLSLVERRASDPDEAWLASFEAAWTRSGRRDVRSSALLTKDIDTSIDPPNKMEALPETDRALCRLMMWSPTYWRRTQPPEALEWARHRGPQLTDGAEVLIAANTVPDSLPVAERLFQLRPDEFWIRLHRWALRRSSGPLGPEDRTELAAMADARMCDAFLGGIALSRLESAARAGGSRTPLMAAAGTAIMPLAYGAVALLERFRASPRPDQTAAADLYVRLARRMLSDRLVMTYALGFRVIELAGTIPETDLAVEIQARRPEFEFATSGPDNLANDPGRWPIPSLIEDVIHAIFRDERAFRARFRAREESAHPASQLTSDRP